MYCQNMSNQSATLWNNNVIQNNSVALWGNTGRNDYWLDGDCAASNNTSLSSMGEAAEWLLWQGKLASANVTLGP
jgi:hypothetical protein